MVGSLALLFAALVSPPPETVAVLVTLPGALAATFTVKGEFDGQRIKLSGAVSDRTYHNRLIDMLVAMKLYDIVNDIQLPAAPRG